MRTLARRLAREERGNAITIFAVTAPMFILFLALALDIGNWYSHKRQLQNRADAGALAAGVEYQARLVACLQTDPSGASAGITGVARDYAGASYNAGNPQGPVSVAINSSTYGGADYSDATGNVGTPCYDHPADASDWVSPAGGRWVDVKVKETNIPTFFGTFGIKLPAVTARARLEVAPATSDNQFIPLGVPDPVIAKAQVRLFNACLSEGSAGYYLTLSNGQTKYDLAPLTDQSHAPQYTTLWGPTNSATNPPTPVAQSQISFTLPSGAACRGAHQGVNGYIPVGVEVRVAGFSWVDLDSSSCSQLHQNVAASRYADCWSDPAEIRVWKDGNPNGYSDRTAADPVVRNVKLSAGGGGTACQYDPHFSWTQGCSTSASVDVDWGDRVGATLPNATYSISLNGVPLADPGGHTGTWTATGAIPALSNVAAPVTLAWSWQDTTKTDTWRGQPCKGNTCKGSSSFEVHQTFEADDNNAYILKLLQVATGGNPGTGAALFDSVNASAGSSGNVYLNIAFQSPFNPQTTNPLTVLRTDTPQGNQSLNCNTQNQGDDFDEYAGGCQNFYTINEDSKTNTFNSTWWLPSTPPRHCPASGTIWGMANDPSLHAWQCVPTAPSPSSPAVACGIAVRTGNAPGATGNACQGNLQCLHPNRYADYIAGTDTPGDPRVVKVFVTPFGAFKGVNGSTDAVPILDFGAFYITGWGADQKVREDPCLGASPVPDDSALDKQIVGHFVKWTDNNTGPADLTQDCDLTELRPCRTVLVR